MLGFQRNKTTSSECGEDEKTEPGSVAPEKSPETEQKGQLAEQTVEPVQAEKEQSGSLKDKAAKSE